MRIWQMTSVGGAEDTLYFDGATIQSLAVAGQIANGGAIELAVKPELLNGDKYIYSEYYPSIAAFRLMIFSGGWLSQYYTGGAWRACYGPAAIVGQWQRVRVEIGGGYMRLYVNRSLVSSVSAGLSGTTMTACTLGGYYLTPTFQGWLKSISRE